MRSFNKNHNVKALQLMNFIWLFVSFAHKVLIVSIEMSNMCDLRKPIWQVFVSLLIQILTIEKSNFKNWLGSVHLQCGMETTPLLDSTQTWLQIFADF